MTRVSLQTLLIAFVHREGISFTFRDQELDMDELLCTTTLSMSTTLTLHSRLLKLSFGR